MRAARRESGQAVVMVVLLLAVLLGMAAAVLDVGSWFRADRRLQATVDAAALAGAHALPESTGDAMALALEYGGKNGGGVEAGNVSFSMTVLPNDTITVESESPAPGFFSKVFGLASVQVHARAKARAGTISAAKWVAPIVVHHLHPMLKCKPIPCFGTETELECHHLKDKGPSSPDGAGSFGFINLTGENNPGTSDLRDQILRGFNDYMELGNYQARTGNPFSSAGPALEERMGDELLFPVYKQLKGTGSGAEYEIIGWVGFVITDMELSGTKEKLYGYFTRVIWEGILSETPDLTTDFGVRAITLVE